MLIAITLENGMEKYLAGLKDVSHSKNGRNTTYVTIPLGWAALTTNLCLSSAPIQHESVLSGLYHSRDQPVMILFILFFLDINFENTAEMKIKKTLKSYQQQQHGTLAPVA
jgi:hypothetical protein